MRGRDQLFLVVSRSDGSTVVVEELISSSPSPSSSRRVSGGRRPGVDRRVLAIPVLTALLVSTSALALPEPPAPATPTERALPVVDTVEPRFRAEIPMDVAPTVEFLADPDPVPLTPDPTAPRAKTEQEPASVDSCRARGQDMPLRDAGGIDPNLVAQMVHSTFECVTRALGLSDRPPTKTRDWDGAKTWQFASLADQVAAEAVVVAYCESLGFRPRALERNNPWGYGGIFQMGTAEMERFGPEDGAKFDPVDNTVAAARYFVWGLERGHPWAGWGPWAVVNTDFDDVNDLVVVPVLPRFDSTDPGHRGRTGPELPDWGVDPWTWTVPEWRGCPAIVGWSWPETEPLP